MRIAFLCNSEFALPSVDALSRSGTLAGLACSDIAPHIAGPLAARAGELGLPFGIVRRSDIAFDLEDWLLAAAPDAALVQTFPYRIPAHILSIPPRGFFNLHPGLLPAYRGPDPIFWQIKRGEPAGGVVLHQMTPAFDDGPIVWTERVPIGDDDTYGVHHNLLIDAALRCVERLIEGLGGGNKVSTTPQLALDAGYQGRPGAEDLTIDWSAANASAVAALARACNPTYGGAIAVLRDTMIRVLEARDVPFSPLPKLRPGAVISSNAGRGLLVLCAGNSVAEVVVVAMDEGTFSGARFAALFGVGIGEKFSIPAFVS